VASPHQGTSRGMRPDALATSGHAHATAVAHAPVSQFKFMRGTRGPFGAMVSGHDDRRAARRQILDVMLQCPARRHIDPREGLIEQQQPRFIDAGARKEHAPQLSVGELAQAACSQSRNPEPQQRAPRGGALQGARRLVETNRRVAPRLHDGLDDEILGMIRLQMGRNEPDLAAEKLERHAALDPGAHDATADRNAMITVQSAQQCGFPRAVRAVYDPTLASAYIKRYISQHYALVKIDARIRQSHDRLRRHSAGASHLPHGAPALRVEPVCERRARQRPAIDHASALEYQRVGRAWGHVFDPVSRQDPGQPRTSAAHEPCEHALPVRRVESVQHFIEQHESRTWRERPRDESQPPLSVRQR
jgi:hypothetical protein